MVSTLTVAPASQLCVSPMAREHTIEAQDNEVANVSCAYLAVRLIVQLVEICNREIYDTLTRSVPKRCTMDPTRVLVKNDIFALRTRSCMST